MACHKSVAIRARNPLLRAALAKVDEVMEAGSVWRVTAPLQVLYRQVAWLPMC
jgi:hypothetical protein